MLDRSSDAQMFVARMGAVTYGAHAIQCRGVQAGKVSVRTASGKPLFQVQAQFITQPASHPPQLPVSRRFFHRGTAKTTFYFQGSTAGCRFQPENDCFDTDRVLLACYPDIYHGLAAGSDHVRSQPAVNGSYVDRNPLVKIIQGKQSLDHV